MLRKSQVALVAIITPHSSHAPLALQCLRAGRHVVCEKPLAITTAQVDAMIGAARKGGVMLSTYHNRHWDGRILQALKLVREKKLIGEIVRIEAHMGGYERPLDWWRSSRRISGGVLYDWGVHLLEYSLQLITAPIEEVSGFAHLGFWAPTTKWKDDTIEDEGFAAVRFRGGQWLTLAITQIDSKGKQGWLEITGTLGTLVLDEYYSTLYGHRGKVPTSRRYPNPPDQGERYYLNVRDHLVRKAPLVITAEWSRRPIHILDLAARSARLGRALPATYR
jgi:predicted dehydrogenase